MKKMIQLLLIVFLFTSCGSNQAKKQGDEASGAPSQSKTSQLATKKFPLERGTIYQAVNAAGFETTPIVYFDKWGDWQATESTISMEVMGVKAGSSTINIAKGDEHWDIDLTEKTGKHYKMSLKVNELGIDLNKLTNEMKKQMKIEDLGEESYLGYKCKKMKIKNNDLKMDMVYLAYGNMMMKMDGEAMGIKTSMKVTKIDTKAPPAEKFVVPDGIKMEEVK